MSLRSQRGFTLIEVMIVMSLALVILGATLTSFTNFERKQKQSTILNDSAQVARNSMDHASRQLRNLANQDPSQQVTTIARALPFDLVFQTSDPSRKWVRYCLDTTGAGGGGATASRAQLWEAETATAAAPTAGMLGSCPGSGWVATKLAADSVTNRHAGRDLPVFTYTCKSTAPPACPSGAADHGRIVNIQAQLYVDPNPDKAPAELRVVSGIYLRNQNEKPVPSFTASPVAGSAAHRDPQRLRLERPGGPDARLRLVPRQRHDHADAGGGVRARHQAEGQRRLADLPRPGRHLPLHGADGRRLADEHPARGPRPRLPLRHEGPTGDHPMTRRNLNREDGWVLVSAIVLMAIMLSVGLSAFAFVDTGQKRSRESRERESSLSLAEASLYAQGFALAKNWPNAGKQLGGDCSSAAALTSATLYCPDRDTLAKGSSSNPSAAQFTDVDFGANADLGRRRCATTRACSARPTTRRWPTTR